MDKTFTPLTPEQYQKARASGFSHEQILQNEQRRKSETTQATIPKKDGFLKNVVKEIVSPFARLGVNAFKAGQMISGKKVDPAAPVKVPFLGEVKPVGQEGSFGRKVADAIGTGTEIASTVIPAGKVPAIAKATFGGKVLQGAKIGATQGAVGGTLFGAGREAQDPNATVGSVAKEAAIMGGTGALGGAALGGGLAVPSAAIRGTAKTVSTIANPQKAIEREVDQLFKSTRGIESKVKLASQKNTDLRKIVSDPVVFKGIKVSNQTINPDEAIGVIDNRIETLISAKREMLPELDRYVPKLSREQIREDAIRRVAGTASPADEQDIINAINKQVDALPEQVSLTELDSLRARFRKSSRDAKGLQKRDSEYSTLENSTRDLLFQATDNLPFDTNGQFAALNTYVKDMLETRQFLDKTLRGQKVKGGRLGIYAGRMVGAIAGIKGGVLGSIMTSELGGAIMSVITNNQLGNSMKMRLIRNITDDPKIIKEVEQLLKKSIDYQAPRLPAGQGPIINQGRPIPVLPKGRNIEVVSPDTAASSR